jgi:quercetin dioxygenase-like cupin family protein
MKGDVITVPAKTPHWWKEIPTGTVAFYAVNISKE